MRDRLATIAPTSTTPRGRSPCWPSSQTPGEHIPLHIHRRGQLTCTPPAASCGWRPPEAAWILPPARALWLPPQWPHTVTMRSHVEMRTVYVDAAALRGAAAGSPMLAEISGLLRELILALLEEPVDYDENGRGGTVAHLILTELGRLRRAAASSADAARRARVAGRPRAARRFRPRARSRPLGRRGRRQPAHAGPPVPQRNRPEFRRMAGALRAIDGLARLSDGASVAETARAVGYASPSAFSAMLHRTLGGPPRRLKRAPA